MDICLLFFSILAEQGPLSDSYLKSALKILASFHRCVSVNRLLLY